MAAPSSTANTVATASTVYFRRPQTPFVKSEGSKADIPQWKLVSGGESDDDHLVADNTDSISTPENSAAAAIDPVTDGGASTIIKADSHAKEEEEGDPMEEDDEDDTNTPASAAPLLAPDDTNTNNDNNNLPQPLKKRLELQVKNHPESVLLCGYFYEEILNNPNTNSATINNNTTTSTTNRILQLSTYLPGVKARELRVYYGEGVLKVAGARALYNCVQRFERSFAVDETLVQTDEFHATLGDSNGTLTIQVPLISTDPPPEPQTIPVVAASPMILFRDRRKEDWFSLDIDVPGVKLKELKCTYSNGVIQLLWERFQQHPSSTTSTTTTMMKVSNGDNNSNSSSKQQMRYQREIPLNTIQIDTHKLIAYLDHITNKSGILTIVAPRKYKRAARPIQVTTTVQ